MSCQRNLVLGLIATLTLGFLSLGVTENAQAQYFRANSRYCPQPVVLVQPICPSVQYYAPTRSFFQTQPGYTLVPIQFATPVISTPGYVQVLPGSYTVAPFQSATVGNFVEGSVIPQNVQGVQAQATASDVIASKPKPVAPAIPVDPESETQTKAPLTPVPANNAENLESKPNPPAAEAPRPEARKFPEPTPATSKSILNKGN